MPLTSSGPTMPATDHAVSSRPWIAPTFIVPNKSFRYAGTVAKPPPYMLMMIAGHGDKKGRVAGAYPA